MAALLYGVGNPWNSVTMDELRPVLPKGRWYKLRCAMESFPVLYVRRDDGISKYFVCRKPDGSLRLLEAAATSRLKCC